MSITLHLPLLYILQCLYFTAITASPSSIWHVSIWEAPAPPPGKGPPLSASSLRDPSYLPAQISSIVAAYIVSVLLIGAAILFVGRRLRRAAQSSPRTLGMEMMKPVKREAFDPSPISPAQSNQLYGPSPQSTVDVKNNYWPSPNKNARNSTGWGSVAKGHAKEPSIQSSVVTFDESIIEEDKERNQREMERLYAAVLDQEEKRSMSAADIPGENRTQVPPELQHLRSNQKSSAPLIQSDSNPAALNQSKSPRAASRPTPLSIHSRTSSRSSFGSFGKKRGIRGLPISPPMGSPDLIPDHYSAYGEAEPLSPRVYDDPGPPPPTPPQRKSSQSREGQPDLTRLSPRDARFSESSSRTPRIIVPAVPAVQTIHESSSRPELSSYNSNNATTTGKTKRTPAPLAIRTQALTGVGSQRSSLRSAPLPLRNPHPTNYNADRPPSTIKATVIERKMPSQTLHTPRTGVPMTPYSPYMPFTPVTPMTPSRLVTREDRKRREKEAGRRVATIDDAVEEEPDMWGDAYP